MCRGSLKPVRDKCICLFSVVDAAAEGGIGVVREVTDDFMADLSWVRLSLA
jgi:hypothetical protein